MTTKITTKMMQPEGTAGHVLTSSGSGASPVWAPAPTGGGGTGFIMQTVADFGAAGNGVTDDTGAFSSAAATGDATAVAPGTYKLASAIDVIPPFLGFGVQFDNGDPNNTYIRNFTDLGRRTLYRQIYRNAAEYTDTPTNYTNLFDFAGFHLDHFSTLGYQQQFTNDSGGRTMQPGFSVNGAHSGYGDVCSFYGNYGISKHPSAASISGAWTGANSGTVTAGQITAVTDKVNLYGSEFHLVDNGNATVSAIGDVIYMDRSSGAFSPYNTLWAGSRVMGLGTKPIDAGFQLTGKAQVGLDFSGVDFELLNGAPSKCAIALKANDRINFNIAKKTPPVWHAVQDVLPPETFMTFDGSKFVLVTAGVVSFQTSNSATTITTGTSIYKGGTLVFDFANADPTKLFMGNSGFTVSINQRVQLTGQTVASSATGGAASALPAAPHTYLTVDIDGTVYKIPVYNN